MVIFPLQPKSDPGIQQLIASISLAVLNIYILFWIFKLLSQMIRTLRFVCNLVKLSLYRCFTNTLILAVLGKLWTETCVPPPHPSQAQRDLCSGEGGGSDLFPSGEVTFCVPNTRVRVQVQVQFIHTY